MITAFEGVSVVPMDADHVVEAQTVVVDGDRISWIGPHDAARLAPGTRRVDGRGRYLMPGLADMHAHPVTEAELLLFVAFGVTTIRNLWGMRRHLVWRERIARGDLLGPTIHTTGPIVDGRPVRNPWSVSVTTDDEAAQAVRRVRAAGYDAVKVYDQLTPAVYAAVVEAARDHGLPVVGHVPFRVGLERVLTAGQASIEHLYGYLEALRPASNDDRPADLTEMRAALLDLARTVPTDRLPELAAATRESGTWNCPTLLLRRRWIEDPARLLRRPEFRYLTPTQVVRWRQMLHGYPTEDGRHRLCELQRATVRALRDAGAGLLVGTDAGVPMVMPGSSIHEELGAFAAAGLTPFEALRAATADPARFLGMAGEWGTVTVGARADLLLLDRNPLADVGNASRLAGVMVRGRWLDAGDLRARLDDLADRQARAGPDPLGPAGTETAPTAARRLTYRVEWAGRTVGEEELVLEPTSAGGHRLRSRASVELVASLLLAGTEAGAYRTVVEVDGDGADRSGRFEREGPDGHDRIDLTRDNGEVRVRRSRLDGGGDDAPVVAGAGVLLGRPLTALYARLGECLRRLAVGDRTEVEVVGPGLPPDDTVAAGRLVVERLPEVDDRDALVHLSFAFERPNARITGTVHCDTTGLPTEVVLDGPSPIRIHRRVAEPAGNNRT